MDAQLHSRLLGRVYDAVVDDGRWPEFVRDLSRSLNGSRCELVLGAPVSPSDGVRYAARFDPVLHRAYRSLVVPAARPSAIRGEAPMATGPRCYQDWLRVGTSTHAIGGCIEFGGKPRPLACWRVGDKTARLAPPAEKLADSLLPHLRRAMNIRRQREEQLARSARGEAALHALQSGVLLVDGRGRSLFRNVAADRMLAADDGLGLRAGRIRLPGRESQRSLDRLITMASRGDADTTGGAVLAPRTGDRPGYALSVVPLAPGVVDARVWPDAVAMVVIADRETVSRRVSQRLVDIYHLTPAELAIARGLLTGVSLQDLATRRGISYETARAHLKRAFCKTGTHSQVELVSLLQLWNH